MRWSEPGHDHVPRHQRGAALLTAMIIVALVATLATSMLWQQWRSVQVEAAERARTQSALILSGALDWASLILREDWKSDQKTGLVDSLGEPWAVPLAEARLSTFLANGDANVEDAPDAFLSGSISDAQARYNLHNLVGGNQVPAAELDALQRLCSTVGVNAGIATQIASAIRDASPPEHPASGASATAAVNPNPPLLPANAGQLGWLGISPEAARALEPYVVILPDNTPININTASREVLASVDGIDVATADRMVQMRQRAALTFGPNKQLALAPGLTPASLARLSVNSSYFEVRGRLRLGDIVLVQRSLVQRRGNGDVVVLQRERVSLRDGRS